MERFLHASEVAPGEAIVFSQGDRSRWTVQREDSFMTLPNDMHMRGSMIIGVDGNSQPAEPQNGRHYSIVA
jgi:hypothetical protein